jgi:glycosyltransferase involved in cell wall biosynthesis
MRIVLDLQGAQSESRFRGIGRYSLALAQAIARGAGHHEVWIALSGRYPDRIEPIHAAFVDLVPEERIRVLALPGPVAEMVPANAWRTQAAELLREKFLVDLRPDVVHISTAMEGLGNEVVASVGRFQPDIPTAVTLYDLIPLLNPEVYLGNLILKRTYLRHTQSLRRAHVLLAISESSRREAIASLDIPPERITTIGAGIDPWFSTGGEITNAYDTLAARYGLRLPFVLYTSAVEPRKNVEALIHAFALLPKELRLAYQLAIVGNIHGYDRERLHGLAKAHGLDNNRLLCLDHVPDRDLRLFYSACVVFVFPSLHEGFGLPILEAMACGAPVLGSNCTSIPEIIDREDALFDPRQPQQIANCITGVLTNPELRDSLKLWGRNRAKTFTWEACADRALRAFEKIHDQSKRTNIISISTSGSQKPVLAFVSPLPPAPSAAAVKRQSSCPISDAIMRSSVLLIRMNHPSSRLQQNFLSAASSGLRLGLETSTALCINWLIRSGISTWSG